MYSNFYSTKRYVDGCRWGGGIGGNLVIYDLTRTWIDQSGLMFIDNGDNVQISRGCIIFAHDFSYTVVARAYGIAPKATDNTYWK